MTRALSAAILLLVACAGVPPRIPSPRLRAQAPLGSAPGTTPVSTPQGSADEALTSDWPAPDWWRRYGDPTLDTLIDNALGTSPSLIAAQARFTTAVASVRTAAAAAGAHVDAEADLARQRLSDNGLLPPKFLGFNWYNQDDLDLAIRYTFDWWGKERAAIAAALDEARASEADRDAAALTLASAIAETYFGWQADQARLALAQAQLVNVGQQRAIAGARLRAQIARVDELAQLDASYAGAREQQIALENSARLRVVMLAALLSCRPEELPPLQSRPLPRAPLQLPADASIDLIARRADVEASRWRVEAALSNIDAARAGFMPDISLRALLGLSSIDLGKLFEAGSAVPQFTAAFHLPIFDAGQLRGRYDATRAALNAAIASYDAAVVTAAREVGSKALALQDYADRRMQRAATVQHSDEQRATALARARQGLTDARPQLVAEAQWLDARGALLQLDAAALDAELALIHALGGGYQRAAHAASAATRER